MFLKISSLMKRKRKRNVRQIFNLSNLYFELMMRFRFQKSNEKKKHTQVLTFRLAQILERNKNNTTG